MYSNFLFYEKRCFNNFSEFLFCFRSVKKTQFILKFALAKEQQTKRS